MNQYKRVKLACYSTNISTALISNLSPLLFLTFRSLYGISYSLLGLLVVVNFSTQLIIDLIFSFFSHKFNIPKVVKLIPFLVIAGYTLFALAPVLFANNVYVGLLLGTVIFSSAGGLCEVLISPIIAAIPSENPDQQMSKLHSIYAWGAVLVIVISTVYLLIFGGENWQWLVLAFMVIPLISAILFLGSTLPPLETPGRISGVIEHLKKREVWLCVFAIFLGGACECTMAQWSSSYLENALNIPKVWGDIFGVALFGVMLGLGRTLYSKIGKNIEKVLLLGAIGTAICYFIAAATNIAIIGLLACAFTGFCASMLWPGSLIVAEKRVPTGGVFIFAMMAAGGDLGASVGPQLVGIITDWVTAADFAPALAQKLSVSTEQLGMKLGMLIGMLFAIVAIFVFLHIVKRKKKYEKTDNQL